MWKEAVSTQTIQNMDLVRQQAGTMGPEPFIPVKMVMNFMEETRNENA